MGNTVSFEAVKADASKNPLVAFAENELALVLREVESVNKEVYTEQAQINKKIMALVEDFAGQDITGAAAGYTVSVLSSLLTWHPLTPLTGEASEWREIVRDESAPADITVYQNRRCPSIFKEVDTDGATVDCFDMNGIICSEDGGLSWFTTKEYRRHITFPCMVDPEPKPVYLKRVGDEYVELKTPEEVKAARNAALAAQKE